MPVSALHQGVYPASDETQVQTLDYYSARAEEYAHRTLNADLAHLYERFLPLVPSGGHILDAGSGSGRDTLHFMEAGYRVTAFDGAKEMARISSKVTGQRTLHRRFQDISFDEVFDGVWANASLLHVPPDEIDDAFQRLTAALKPGGVLFCSFKRGQGEYVEGGRYFNCYTEESIARLIARHSDLACIEMWTNPDAGREELTWLNALMRKTY